jgi:hypothetical protein
VRASDIGQESAYTGKPEELPTGTFQGSPSLCTKQRKNTNHKIFVSEKHIQKDVFFSENFRETSHTFQREFLSKEYPTHGFF